MIFGYILIGIISFVLLVIALGPFVLSSMLSHEEEDREAAHGSCESCDRPDDMDCIACAAERVRRLGGRAS